MGKFHKTGGAKQGVQVQKNLHSVHKTIHKNKKQKSISKNKNVVSILQNGKSKVKDVAGMLSDVVEERKMNLGKDLKKGKENIPAKFDSKDGKKMKKKGKHGHVASPQQSPPKKTKKPFQKEVLNGGKHSQKQVQQDNCVGKPKRDLNNKNKIKKKKQKQTVRKNYVLLRQPSSSEDEDEDEDEDEEAAADNETSVKLEHLNATLGSSTDSDDDEFDPKEESDAEMSDAHSGDSVVSDDIADLSGDDSTEEKVLEDGGDESDSDEDDDNDDESDQVEKNESLKVQHLNATLPSSDDEDEEYVPDKDEAKLKSPKKKKNKDESLNLTALENTINSSDEDDDDYVPDESVGEVQDDSSDADSDEESDDEPEDKSVATKKAPKRKAKKEEEDSDENSELEDTVAIEGKANDTKEIKEYLASLKPFDEKAFREIVSAESVQKIVEALMKQVKEEMSKKKDKIFTDYRYILQVTSFKIPKCPRRMAKLRLKHSLITEDDDVCFIVRDLERGRKVDYEETVHHYEELFAEKGIKGIKAIMPFNQIRNEYKTYESKIKLSNLYDYYLCDGAIVGHVVGFLGKHFQKPRSTPYAVRMDNKDLATEVQKAMHKTSFKQNNKGPTIAIPVGHCHMNIEQITENIMTIVDQLKESYPGGLENIRNMNIKINLTGTSSLPIYISFCRPPVTVPNVVGPKEKHLKEIKKKTNEILQKFSMTQTGELVKLDAEQVLKRKKEIKAATKAKKAKLEEGDKKSPTKTENKSPSKDGKAKSDKDDAAEDEQEANKSLNVSKKEKSNKDKSLNVSKKEKAKNKSLDVSKQESVSPKKESEKEKSKKKKLQEVEDDEESDEEDDEHEVEGDDEDDSDEEEGDDNEDEDDEDDDEDEDEDDDDDDDEDEE